MLPRAERTLGFAGNGPPQALVVSYIFTACVREHSDNRNIILKRGLAVVTRPAAFHLKEETGRQCALPSTIDDMRAFFGDRIKALDDRMHSTATDMWEAYWDGAKPRGENFCRNRLVEHISGQLPDPIRFAPEMHMPQQKRTDIAAILGSIGLPVEIKGQWHPEVWTAPVKQLAARYLHDWHAEGRGAYIVLWFGDVPGKNLPAHPDGLARPKTPHDLRTMLIDQLPENLRDVIDVYVVNISRPAEKASPAT